MSRHCTNHEWIKGRSDSPLASGKLPTGEQIAFDLLPTDSFAESDRLGITHEGDEPPLVAGGYLDDQSKWYDGTGEYLLYALGFLSGAAIAAVAIYFLF